MEELLDRLLQVGEHPPDDLMDDIIACGDATIPLLIEMATDRDLIWAESDSPQVWAPTHAMRLLGRLRAVPAVKPLISLLDEEEAEWIRRQLPDVMGRIGPAAIEPLRTYVGGREHFLFGRAAAVTCLVRVVQAYPETRDDVLGFFRPLLSAYPDETPDDEILCGLLIADLLDLEARELYPEIEAAFLGDRVDETIVDLDYVQRELGIRDGAKPRKRADFELRLVCTACGFERSHDIDVVYYDQGTAEREQQGEDVPYSPFVIPQEITCPRCGAVNQYKLAPMAHFALISELLKILGTGGKAKTPGLGEGTRRLRIIEFALKEGQRAHPLEAMEYYRRQIERHPDRAEYHLSLANVMRFLGRWVAAEAEYQQAWSLNPNDASPLAGLGGMATLHGDDERALAYYEMYLEQVPTRPRNSEDAEVWDAARETVRELRGEKMSLPGRVVSTPQERLSSPKPSTALGRTRERTRSSRPRQARSSKGQARRKRKKRPKAARKARRRK